uniref:Carbamate kinase n=1 Tax=Trichomonas vaginalis TaxID=5722 RepID=CBK_TRIVA|nr:RecName: Full=Carbamate kinase [Trichomonas vaginalis]AAD02507.1 carbamate kinase [Trichomonas vaginalis]
MRIVVALGGNALLQRGMKGTFQDQQAACRLAMSQIVKIVKDGNELVMTHGNGPQCGAIFLQNVAGEQEKVPAMPLHVCGAETQGFLGELLQQELDGALRAEGIKKNVVSIVTQSFVDPKDPAFQNPTKPIGPFYSKEEAEFLRNERGYNMVEDAGRGYRMIVPSPVPQKFVEKEAIKTLVNSGFIVVCSGGGGIPVILDEQENRIEGVDAVIDKDLGASVLAAATNADAFMILTDVPEALLNYRKENETAIRQATVAEMEKYIEEGHFIKGSMLPKVQACLRFVKSTGKPALITALDCALQALKGERGTKIVPN